MAWSNIEKKREYQKKWMAQYRKDHRDKHLNLLRNYMRKKRANGNGYKMWLKQKGDKAWYKRLLKYQKQYRIENKDKLTSIERNETARLGKEYLLKQLKKDGISRKVVSEYPDLLLAKKLILKIKRLTDGTSKKHARID